MDVRRGLRGACLVWCLAPLYACGGDEDVIDLRDASYPEEVPADAGDGGDAGRRDASAGGMDASSDGGDAGADGSIDIDASTNLDASLADANGPGGDGGDAAVETRPEVMVLAPSPSIDPADGLVLTGTTVAVQCAAHGREGRGIASVTIAIFDQTDANVPKVQVPGVYGGDGGYANTMVSLANIASGRIRIRCTAIDDVADPEVGWAEIETLYDGGPLVSFDNPTEGKIVARGGADPGADLNVRFRVTPAPLTAPSADAGAPDAGAAQDPDANIDTVTLVINDVPVPMLTGPVDGVYSADLDFWTFFNHVPIDRAAFEVVATNHRGVTVKKKVNVQVDGVGPEVAVTNPPRAGDAPPFVGGIVEVRATASDALAGYGSAKALIQTPSGIRSYTMSEISPGIIGFDFDANSFTDKALIVAQIQVFDKVGNMTEVSHTMIVDTVGPWVSLDAPNVRIAYTTSANKCSGSFDPTGVTPKDGQVIQQQARFRAVVYERATQVDGATEYYYAGVRAESVDFVAQPYGLATDPSSGRQLLVDRDGDGVCDIVDDSPVTAGQLTPFRVRMRSVSTGGTAPDAESPLGYIDVPIPVNQCGAPNITGATIAPKCTGNDMTYVLSHPADGSSVIYGYEPGSGITCTGTSMDFGGPAGWYCATTVARDKSGSEGNLSIAEPIRVCRKLQAGDCEGASPGSILPPPAGLTCTDGCTLPAVWTAPTMPPIVPQ